MSRLNSLFTSLSRRTTSIRSTRPNNWVLAQWIFAVSPRIYSKPSFINPSNYDIVIFETFAHIKLLNLNRTWMPHSRFGHYFCINLYGRAPRGPRGVKKSEFFFTNKTVEFLRQNCPKKAQTSKNHQNWKKRSKNTCFLRLF